MNTTTVNTKKMYSAAQYFAKGSGMATLCGSTRYDKEAFEAHLRLTLAGWTVLMCGFWVHGMHKDHTFTDEQMAKVKQLHFQKLLESDVAIIVSDKTGYIGDSTREEIAFCKARNIPIFYFDGDFFSGHNECKLPQRYADSSLIDSFRSEYANRSES